VWLLATLTWYLLGTGFHRELVVNGTVVPPLEGGTTSITLTLPVVHSFYVDVSQRVKSFKMTSNRPIDLELPQHRVEDDYFVDLHIPVVSQNFEIKVPVHFRYPAPTPFGNEYTTQCFLPFSKIMLDGSPVDNPSQMLRLCARVPVGHTQWANTVRYATLGSIIVGGLTLIVCFVMYPRSSKKYNE